jgi:hypothetical protein
MIALDDSFKFRKRYKLSPFTTILDVADYKRGYVFSLRPFIAILKIKTSKLMEKDKHLTVISLFGRDFIRE